MKSGSAFASLLAQIHAAGRYTSYRDHGEYEVLVCVSDRDENGRLCGNSIIVTQENDDWYISNWGASISYRVPPGQDIATVCLDCLDQDSSVTAQLPSDIIHRYALVIVTGEEGCE